MHDHTQGLAVRLLHQHLQHLVPPLWVAPVLLDCAVHVVLRLRPQLNLERVRSRRRCDWMDGWVGAYACVGVMSAGHQVVCECGLMLTRQLAAVPPGRQMPLIVLYSDMSG